MSNTQLFWQRNTPLADFADSTHNGLILVTNKNSQHVIDDILDDVRNDVIPVIAVLSGEDNGQLHVTSLETNAIDGKTLEAPAKEQHLNLTGALVSVLRKVSGSPGSVVVIDSTSVVIDQISRSTVFDLMQQPDIHVVLLVAVEGIEAMHYYLPLDPHIVIDVTDNAESVSY